MVHCPTAFVGCKQLPIDTSGPFAFVFKKYKNKAKSNYLPLS